MVINLIITIGLLELYARLTQPIRPLLVVKQTIDKLVKLAESDLDFNPSMQQIEQNVLPVFDSLVFF